MQRPPGFFAIGTSSHRAPVGCRVGLQKVARQTQGGSRRAALEARCDLPKATSSIPSNKMSCCLRTRHMKRRKGSRKRHIHHCIRLPAASKNKDGMKRLCTKRACPGQESSWTRFRYFQFTLTAITSTARLIPDSVDTEWVVVLCLRSWCCAPVKHQA
jgi:hypothetical protein